MRGAHRKRRVRTFSLVAVFGILATMLPVLLVAAPAIAVDPVNVQSSLVICKGDVQSASYLENPDADEPFETPFICSNTLQGAGYLDYSGNAGKGWNELDLVPFRMTLDAGNNAPNTQTYTKVMSLDASDSGQGSIQRPGFDFLSIPTLNSALSHASCSLDSVGPQISKTPGFGGTDTTIYRSFTMTQSKGTKCVLDFDGRLAVGSHLYPGASLHGNEANEALTQVGQDRSIPVNEIQPQSITKDMAGTQNYNQLWNLTKSAQPLTLSFGDTCANGNGPFTDTVEITVEWTKLGTSPTGTIHLVSNVYATNPAHRTITVTATDTIFGSGGFTDTKEFDPVDVPANTTNFLLGTFETTAPTGTTDLYDEATAEYTDKDTGVAIPGTTFVRFPASGFITVADGVTNFSTVQIHDEENITGTGLDFSVAAPSVGSFDGYTAGEFTTGPVKWDSGDQTASGSVTFTKTVRLDEPRITTGTLSDTATISSGDTELGTAGASTDISSTATVSLTINKSIDVLLDEDVTFSFDYSGAASGSADVTILAGDLTGSTTVSDLPSGSYDVSEQDPGSAWTPGPDQQVDIDLPNCSGSVTFENTFNPPSAKAIKVTDPVGSEADWDMTLTGSDGSVETKATGADGEALFETTLVDGVTYTITETLKDGFEQIGSGSGDCEFTVDLPEDADLTFACTYTNRALGKIIVQKETDPDGSSQTFDFTTDYAPGGFSLGDGGSNDSGYLTMGTYSVSETVPDGWELTSATCDDGSDPGSIALAPAETVTCTFNNTQQGNIIVHKITDPAGSTQQFPFTASYDADGFSLQDGESDASGFLTPGNYSVSEQTPTGWDLTESTCSDSSDPASIALGAGETVNCYFTNTERGKIIVIKQTDPDGSTQTFDFTASYDGDGFTLGDGEQNESDFLVPGSYSVAETPVDGWDLTTPVVCSDGSDPASIGLEAGEIVTCTFENTQRGHIIIQKETDPDGSTQEFDFTADYDADGFFLSDGGSNDSGALIPGTYSVSETVPDGWDLTTPVVCSDGSDPLSIGLGAGETVTCTFTNVQRGHIIVVKETNPDGSTQVFDFTATYDADGFSLSDGESNDSGALVPGTYTVGETVPDGWQLLSATCTDGSDPATIDLGAGETVTCTFVNREYGHVRVLKTVFDRGTNSPRPPSGTESFVFELWTGLRPDTDPNGETKLETKTANAGNGGDITFDTDLVPGDLYQICEIVPVGWLTDLAGDSAPFTPRPPNDREGDNSRVCVDFTVEAGETRTFEVLNTPPPGGAARTIGYWKNWNTCTGGGQTDSLGAALAAAGGSILIGDLTVNNCTTAVKVLDKRLLNGKKAASDPAVNLAAQLLAAKLNVAAGAGTCPAANLAIQDAQALLDLKGYDGTKTGSIPKNGANTANTLANKLDQYNNNELC